MTDTYEILRSNRFYGRKTMEFFAEKFPKMRIDIDEAMSDVTYRNEVLMEANRKLLAEYRLHGSKTYWYALTVTDGEEPDPRVLIARVKTLMEIEGVGSIVGNVELTKEGKPHLHCTVRTTKYLNKRSVGYRLKKFFHMRKNKTKPEHWVAYCSKDLNDPVLRDYLKNYDCKPNFKF